MKITAKFQILIVAVLILSVVLVSCGGSEKSTTAPKQDTVTEAFEAETTESGGVVVFPEVPF